LKKSRPDPRQKIAQFGFPEDKMKKLASVQAKYLRGIAHALKPVVFVGQKGVTNALIKSADEAFRHHELIKVKFIDFKDKEQKKEIAAAIENKTDSRMAGMIGHVAIFYKQHRDPDKRKIVLPL
jgi:RNA-binding protein